MTARRSRSTTIVHMDAAPTWPQRSGRFLLRMLEELGSYPSALDPWLLLTPYRVVRRSVDPPRT
jgi:hypothetical protein